MAKRGGAKRLTFYVFYDKNDFVRYFGTAYDLVAQGIFKDVETVYQNAYHQAKRRPNSVVKMVVPKYCKRSVYAK